MQASQSGFAQAPGGHLYFEVYGPSNAPALMIFNSGTSRGVAPAHHQAMRDGLANDFRLIFWDYPPGLGASARAPSGPPMTAARVADDYLAVADAAGAKTFAYLGYSYGGNSGLQFAARYRDRVDALMIGGWPALGGDFAAMLSACEGMVERLAAADKFPDLKALIATMTEEQLENVRRSSKDFASYYKDILSVDEAALISGLSMPRLNFADANDLGGQAIGAGAEIGPTLIARASELEAMGWRTDVLRTGATPETAHAAAMAPEVLIPLVKTFLGAVRS